MTVDIDKLQALLDAATLGEWRRDVYDNGASWNIGTEEHAIAMTNQLVGDPLQGQPMRTANTALIVAMKNALPELLAMARELERVRAALPFCDGNGEAYYVRATVEQNARLKAKVQAVTEQDQRLDALEIITKAECEKARAERDRYLAALKAEACKIAKPYGDEPRFEDQTVEVGGITFRVKNAVAGGSLQAEEVE